MLVFFSVWRVSQLRVCSKSCPTFREAFNVNDRPAAINRDKLSQKAWWKVNLTFLETKKKVLEEMKLDLDRKLWADLETAMKAPSFLGCGYTDYSFLHT